MMLDQINYYSVLQVKPGATDADVRAAYKRLAFQYHPDRSDHPQANLQMQLLNEAYAVLGSPEKRAQYDLERIHLCPEAPIEKTVEPDIRAGSVRPRRDRQLNAWLLSQLKNILRLLLFVSLLFLWSMVTGQVNLVAVLLLVFLVIMNLLVMIKKLHSPVRQSAPNQGRTQDESG